MKIWHWLILLLVLIGALYVLHNYRMHGGIAGVKGGLGLGGF